MCVCVCVYEVCVCVCARARMPACACVCAECEEYNNIIITFEVLCLYMFVDHVKCSVLAISGKYSAIEMNIYYYYDYYQ